MNERQLNRKKKEELVEMILDLQTKERDEPMTCPSCNSDDITYTDTFLSGSIEVRCDECNSSWYELWRFVDVEMIDGEDNRVAQLE